MSRLCWCRTTTLRSCHGCSATAFPRATILTFWHIPWPNPERFAICPQQRRLLDGLLGSSIVGFQTPLHCRQLS